MAMTYAQKQKVLRLGMAAAMFYEGRDIRTVKEITGLTLVEMKRQGLIVEVIIPDPKGFSEDGRHNGHMIHTGMWRCAIGEPDRTRYGKSNGQLKREDRKAFFNSRRWRKRHANG